MLIRMFYLFEQRFTNCFVCAGCLSCFKCFILSHRCMVCKKLYRIKGQVKYANCGTHRLERLQNMAK